jgi:small multidrug resistance family-3 protein
MLRWQSLPALIFLIIATVLESAGDAVVRKALHAPTGAVRLGLFLGGAILLLSYGTFLNLAPLDFSRVIGLYLATLFVIWQAINFIFFHTLPSLPTFVGGALVVAGGLIVTYWRPG